MLLGFNAIVHRGDVQSSGQTSELPAYMPALSDRGRRLYYPVWRNLDCGVCCEFERKNSGVGISGSRLRVDGVYSPDHGKYGRLALENDVSGYIHAGVVFSGCLETG